MEQVLENRANPSVLWRRLWQAAGMVIALPFLVGAVELTVKLVRLPSEAGYLTMAQMLGSALFSFGISLGILGTAFALTSKSLHTRTLYAALTLFGCSHVVMGFVVRRSIEESISGNGLSLLPFIIPAVLWVCSVLLAIKAHGSEPSTPAPAEEPTAEQQLPLSRP